MINLDNQKYDLSRAEAAAIDWFNRHGFTGKLEKQFVSKTVFTVEKDGVAVTFELPQGIIYKDIEAYMDMYGEMFKQKIKMRSGENENDNSGT